MPLTGRQDSHRPRRAGPGPDAVRPGPRRVAGPGRRGRPRLPPWRRLGAWRVPRRVAVLHAVRLPDHLPARGRASGDRTPGPARVLVPSRSPARARGAARHRPRPGCHGARRARGPARLRLRGHPRSAGTAVQLALRRGRDALRQRRDDPVARPALLVPRDRGAVLPRLPADRGGRHAAGHADARGRARHPDGGLGGGAGAAARIGPCVLRHRHAGCRTARRQPARVGVVAPVPAGPGCAALGRGRRGGPRRDPAAVVDRVAVGPATALGRTGDGGGRLGGRAGRCDGRWCRVAGAGCRAPGGPRPDQLRRLRRAPAGVPGPDPCARRGRRAGAARPARGGHAGGGGGVVPDDRASGASGAATAGSPAAGPGCRCRRPDRPGAAGGGLHPAAARAARCRADPHRVRATGRAARASPARGIVPRVGHTHPRAARGDRRRFHRRGHLHGPA